MIDIAFAILAAAGLIGAALAILHARGPGSIPASRVVPTVHAAAGAAGLGALIAALRHGPGAAAARMGTQGFGPFAAALIGLAFLLGIVIAARAWRGRYPGGALIGAHATCAVAGITLLLALIALG